MFYDNMASQYDEMIPLEKRVNTLKKQLGHYVEKYKIKSALDAGSATGATSIALAQMGVDVRGIEYSPEMVKIANMNNAKYNLKIPYLVADLMDKIPEYKQKFDTIFVLANTISHFLDKRSLARVISNFSKWLLPGGLLVMQYLNYHRIFRDRKRIVKIMNSDSRTFVRFYDFGRKTINFNLLTIDNNSNLPAYTLDSIPIRGWSAVEMTDILKNKGFSAIKKLGDIAGSKFDLKKSNDLVIISRKI
jgi:glycine/sarcosine N-methyltransferase